MALIVGLLVLMGPPITPAMGQDTHVEPTGLDSPVPPPPMSMGQPVRIPLTWGPLLGYDFGRDEAAGRLFVDLTRRDLIPLVDATIEGAVGISGSSFEGAVGAYLGLPWILGGIEYNSLDKDVIFGLVVQFAGKRGGILRHGDRIRIDYRPAPQEVLVGMSFRNPFQKYRMTRPRERAVSLPKGKIGEAEASVELGADVESALSRVEHAVEWLDRLLAPRFSPGDKFEESAVDYRTHIRQPGHTFDDEDSTYHHELENAFRYALAGDSLLASTLTREAESILFREVLVPFNSEFGQEKSPNDAGGFCLAARDRFASYLDGVGDWRDGARDRVDEIFRRVLKAIQQASVEASNRWKDTFLIWNSRASLGWLPLNYGLRPHQYDTQAEWDSVLTLLTGQPFEQNNLVEYLMYEQFHIRLKAMIREAHEYQVTIVHDFRAKTSDGAVDIYGWDMVVDGYLAAMTQAVLDLDSGHRRTLPQFFLFLDENYYRANKSRRLITFLERLYEAEPPKLNQKAVRQQIVAARDSLLSAIALSPTLSGLDAEDLKRAFRVNVNITNPFDPAFSLDVARRDHRKIAFRDVTESDPAAGAAVFTGQGIGAHYNGSAWEDRSIIVRGPSLVQLKTETRSLFLSQGFKDSEVPECLRPDPYPDDYPERCATLADSGWITPVSIDMNETGYGYKKASVLKTAMYNLAPDSSFVLTFDSLWLSDFWGAMFISAALRGAHMFPVGPTPGNAPSNAGPTLYYLRENLDLLLRAQNFFAEDIRRAGGMLRVGIYAHSVPINNLGQRAVSFLQGRREYAFLQEEFPFNPMATRGLEKYAAEHQETPLVELRLRPRPLLHLKTQLFGTREARAVFPLVQWIPIVQKHLAIRERQLDGITDQGLTPELLETTSAALGITVPLEEAFRRTLEQRAPGSSDKAIFTFTTGSHNQNPRSMLLDGEVLVAVSGFDSLISAIDFMFILGIASWPSTIEELERLFPKQRYRFYYGLLKYQL